MRISLIVSASVVITAFASLVACSAGPSIPDDLRRDEDNTAAGPKKDGGAAASKKDGGSSTPPTSEGPTTEAGAPQGTGACAPSATKQACFECCEAANPKALPILNVEFDKCACVTPGKCKAACATTFCASPRVQGMQGDACDVCLTTADTECVQQIDAACIANPDCKPLFTCDDDALCSKKP